MWSNGGCPVVGRSPTNQCVESEPGAERTGQTSPCPSTWASWAPGRAGEYPAPGVDQVLAQGVLVGQALLDGDELPTRVLLEADEEEPGIELPTGRVDAVGEAVAPPQEGLAVVGGRRRLPDVRAVGDEEQAVGPESLEIDRVRFAAPPERGAARLDPSDGLLLVSEGAPVPSFEMDPDPPGHQVGPSDTSRAGRCYGRPRRTAASLPRHRRPGCLSRRGSRAGCAASAGRRRVRRYDRIRAGRSGRWPSQGRGGSGCGPHETRPGPRRRRPAHTGRHRCVRVRGRRRQMTVGRQAPRVGWTGARIGRRTAWGRSRR
jgi:hypothetical protein